MNGIALKKNYDNVVSQPAQQASLKNHRMQWRREKTIYQSTRCGVNYFCHQN